MDPEEQSKFQFFYQRNPSLFIRVGGLFVVVFMFALIPLVVFGVNQNHQDSTQAVLGDTAATAASVSLISSAVNANGGNTQPLHPTRLVNLTLYNTDTQQKYTVQGSLTFDGTQIFKNANFSLGTIPSGTYQILADMPGHLEKLLTQTNNTNTFSIQAGTTVTIPAATLIAGDDGPIPGADGKPYGDNVLDIEDYNVLLGCYSDTQAAISCSDVGKAAADLNDDGKVDAIDYNILLRSFLTRNGDSLPVGSTISTTPTTGGTTTTPTGTIATTGTITPTEVVTGATNTPTPTGSTTTLTLASLSVADSANASKWSLQTNIQSGDTLYGDKTYKFTSMPSDLAGSAWIRSANASKAYTGSPTVTFSISRQATVYVTFDTRSTLPSWVDSSWTNSGMTITDNESPVVTFRVYQKTFPAGTVSLGRNATQTYGVDMYNVIVK